MVEEKKLTRREIKFCELYVETGKGAESAREAGFSKKAAKEIAYRMLTYDHIKAYIKKLDDQKFEENKRKFELHTELAINTLVNIAQAGRVDMARVQAANSLLDRAGHKPVEQIKADINTKNDTKLTLPDESTALDNLTKKLTEAAAEAQNSGSSEESGTEGSGANPS